jgi:hypothetical protein
MEEVTHSCVLKNEKKGKAVPGKRNSICRCKVVEKGTERKSSASLE